MKKFIRLLASFLFLSLLSSTAFAQNKDWLLKMQDPNVNFWELQKEFNDYWKNRTDYKGNGYKVFKRWEYINEVRVLADGKLLAPDYVMREYERYMADAPLQKSASGTWNIVGPTTYPSNNTSQPTGKGRINAIAFHPNDASTLYIGSPSGGIWKSTDDGASWNSLSANIPYLGVSAILVHPTDPNIIYIGTGDRDSEDAPGVGVYKTTDGGATWAPANSGMGNTTVGMMLMNPNDPNMLFAATYGGIFKSVNAGASWTLTQAGDFRDIKFKPGDPSIMYAARIVTPSEFYRSTTTGDSWTQIAIPTAGVGSRMVIGVSPANASYVYLVQIKNNDGTFQALLRSTNSGQTFSQQSNSPNIFDYACNGSGTASQATYDLCIEVDKTDEDIVYVGSINSWKSSDGGVNWSPVSHWVGSNFAPGDPTANCAASVHADHHCYEWSPLHNPDRLYLGHDGGIAYTANGGTTWTDITSNLPIGQVYKIGQSAHTANTVLAGFQDNGVSGTTNGVSFTTVAGGDGGECAVDYSNANFCYRETQNGALRRSSTGALGSGSNIISALFDPTAFIAPYMLHRTVHSTMFFPRTNVWRSTNVTASPSSSVTWDSISTFAAGATIRVIEQSPANLDIVYISRGSGASSVLYRSDNANAAPASVTWTTIPKPQGLTVTDIKANPTDENIVYATAGMKVFKSTNKGGSWTDISGNLPALFVNCLVLDKDANEGIYIGNQTGVWYKDATVSEWILFSSSLPPVDVRELEIYYDANPDNSRITAATYGRGIWQSDLIQINVVNPSNLTATPFNNSQIDLAWTLNAANNNVLIATSPTTTFGLPVDGTGYMAGDPLPGGGTVIYVGNLTNFNHTGLNPGATYCYKIWSVNGSNQYSAGLPPVCASTLSHDWTGNVNTDWFNTGNWGPGTLPTSADGAYIPAGRPNYPLINAAGATCFHLTIESGASLSMHASTPYTLQVAGDWLNNGTFTRGVGTVQFNGTNALQTIKGASNTDFNILQLNKGAQGNIVEAQSIITLNAATNPLVLTGGTFKLSSASTITPFTNGTGADLSSVEGLWNNGGTINSGNFSWTLNTGLLRVSAGTVNVGTAAGNSMTYLNNGTVILEGGALNIAGRFSPNSGTSICAYTQSAGILTVNTVGTTSTTRAPFEINANASFSMSGGTIAIRRASSHTTADVIISATSNDVSGGTLQIGDAATPAGQTIRINSSVPVYNLTVNAANAPTAQLVTNALTVKNDATISGGTLNANNLNMNVGGHWTNNGTFTPGTGIVTFNGTANQNLAGSNATTFNSLTLNNAAGLTLSGSVHTTVNGTLTLTSGVITTGNNKVIIPATGSVARTAGHIFGNLQKNVATGSGVSRTFEIGDAAAANYTPVALNFASVSVAGNLTARTVSGDHPQIGSADLNASKSVNRYWTLTNSGTTFTSYNSVFNFLSTDLDPSVSTAALIGGKYDSPDWTYPSIGARTANSTELTGGTSFSDFQLAEPSCVIPDVPTLSATVNPICSGQSTTLSISTGNLNGAANWQWYSGSCGGAPEGMGSSLMVSPTTNTTYFARGEGGCVITPGSCASITITVPTIITLTETHVNVLCNGGNTGSIDLTVSGGSSPYTYSWTGGATTQDRSDLTAGTYTVTVTDTNACTKTLSTTITEPANLVLTETHVNVLCNGNSTGSIDLTVSGGTGAYTYSWTGGATTQDRSGLTAGTYTVTVTDANACTKTLSTTITEPANLVLTETHVNVLCNGNSTGSIDLTVSGGTGAYTYSWTGGATTQDRSGLTAGTYTVTVTDANACTKTLSTTITEPANMVLTETHVNVLCNGNSTGSIDLTVSGGTGAYTYSWTGGATTQDRSGLTAGTYTVTVTDANACTKTLSTTITEPANLVLTETHVNVLCNGNSTGSIDLTVSGGTGAYTYSWTGGATTQDRSGLAAGTYTVTVTDANTCTKTLSVTITEPASMSLTETHVNVLCNGGNTGSIDLTVSGGSSPYTYSWTGGATTQDRSGLTAGTYTVTVTDANTCTKTLSVTITEPASMSLTETHVNVLCNGGNTGSIDLTVSGGSSPYTYSWTGGATTQDRSGLTAGTYTVTVTDANTCTKTLSVTITEPASMSLTETHVNVLCNGGNTGSIDLTVSGGSSPYTYSWTGGATTQDRSGLTAGTYTVTVTDANTCTKTLSVTITEPAAMSLTETHVNVLCNGGNTGSIDLTVSGGSSPYTYSWTGGATTQDRSGLTAGTYTVTVTDANTCTKTLSVTITEPASMSLTETHVNVLCNGGNTGSIDLTVSGGSSPYTYSWTGGATTQDRSGLAAGTYTVTVTDANTCTKTLSVTITEPASMSLTETHVNVLCNGGNTGSIDLTVSGGSSPYTYSWTGGATTQDRSGLTAGTYTVTVTDANSCTKTLSVTITQPAALVLNSTIVNPSNCFVADGSIDLSVSGGTLAYTYDWSNDGPDTPDNDPQDLLNLVEGAYTVTVTDANGCTATHARTLDYIDIIPPVIICPGNQNVSANATCMGTVGSWTPVSVSDNCTPSGSIVVTQAPPPTTGLNGHNASVIVTLTANDGNGNTSSCTFTVTLKDVTPPVAKCQNITANLGSNGTVTIPPAAINNGSTDNCSITFTLTPNTFNCAQIGMNLVTLKATDAGGNTSTCTAKVTVKDQSAPKALCKNPTIFLNSVGQATLSVAEVNNGSTDNCGIATISINKTLFNCSEISGTQPVILSTMDMNGNVSSCLSNVTVKDAIAPTAICEDATVELSASGYAVVYGEDLAVQSTDNCSVWSYSPVAKVYTAANLGNNNLTITVKDWSGNSTTCVSIVTVEPHNQPSNQPASGDKPSSFLFNVYPNPSTGDVFVAFELPAEQLMVFQVYDLHGRMVLHHEAIGLKGENTQPLRLEGIAPGVYMLYFESAGWRVMTRLVVQGL